MRFACDFMKLSVGSKAGNIRLNNLLCSKKACMPEGVKNRKKKSKAIWCPLAGCPKVQLDGVKGETWGQHSAGIGSNQGGKVGSGSIVGMLHDKDGSILVALRSERD